MFRREVARAKIIYTVKAFGTCWNIRKFPLCSLYPHSTVTNGTCFSTPLPTLAITI